MNEIEEAIQDIKNGKMVIVADDEDRENEGDLVCAAEKVTPEIINFMIKEARGLICVPLTQERANELIENNNKGFDSLAKQADRQLEHETRSFRGYVTGLNKAEPGFAREKIRELRQEVSKGGLELRRALSIALSIHYDFEESVFEKEVSKYVERGEPVFIKKHKVKLASYLTNLSSSLERTVEGLALIANSGLDLTNDVFFEDVEGRLFFSSLGDALGTYIVDITEIQQKVNAKAGFLDMGVTLSFVKDMVPLSFDFFRTKRNIEAFATQIPEDDTKRYLEDQLTSASTKLTSALKSLCFTNFRKYFSEF